MQTNETHKKIIEAIKNKGPSLPIQLAKELNMNSLFISAFLSELAREKRIKISHLKVGGSPLYFIEGQEEQLENYYRYLPPKEAETFLLLKKRKVLKDSDQDPATRVALRSLRDFSVGFKINEQIYWRYIQIPESEIKKILHPEKTEQKQEKPKNTQIKISKKQSSQIITDKTNTNEFQNPLVIETQEKPKKQKPKSEFVQNTISFLKQNNLAIIEEKDYKAKEYNCIIQINSQLGNIKFLTQAKDKKTITETDFKKLLSKAQSIPLPAFLIFTGTISKKAKEYLRKYSSVLKAKKLNNSTTTILKNIEP
jgi:hypothetical protein